MQASMNSDGNAPWRRLLQAAWLIYGSTMPHALLDVEGPQGGMSSEGVVVATAKVTAMAASTAEVMAA